MSTPQAQIRHTALLRRIIYVLVATAVIVPYLAELPLPFEPFPWARRLYDKVDALEPGSPVLLAFDYDPASKAELYPMSLAILRHCFKNDLVPIIMTHWQSGLGLCQELVEKAADESEAMWGKQKLSGRDYVLLGFRPGFQNLVLNMGESIQSAFAMDYYGEPTDGMPALAKVKSLKDFPLAIDLAAGATVEMWIAYGADRFGFDLGAGTTAVIAPDLYPFLQSKQLVGFLGGLRGAADYETLLERAVEEEIEAGKRPSPKEGAPERAADATRGMPSQSATHILIIVLILAANVRYLVGRLRKKKS